MAPLVLRMSTASALTVLRDLRPGDRFRVVYDDALPEHTVQFLTEQEWAAGDLKPDDVERWINFNGTALHDDDLDDVHASLEGRNPFCERYPDACRESA